MVHSGRGKVHMATAYFHYSEIPLGLYTDLPAIWIVLGVVDDPATDSVRIDGAYRFSFLSLVSYWEQKMAGIAYTSVALVQ